MLKNVLDLRFKQAVELLLLVGILELGELVHTSNEELSLLNKLLSYFNEEVVLWLTQKVIQAESASYY